MAAGGSGVEVGDVLLARHVGKGLVDTPRVHRHDAGVIESNLVVVDNEPGVGVPVFNKSLERPVQGQFAHVGKAVNGVPPVRAVQIVDFGNSGDVVFVCFVTRLGLQ